MTRIEVVVPEADHDDGRDREQQEHGEDQRERRRLEVGRQRVGHAAPVEPPGGQHPPGVRQ